MAGQVWSVSADGGYLYSDKLSNILRLELIPTVRFRQLCDIREEEAQGKHRGDRWYWNVYSKVATKGSAVLDETARMPETKFTITQESGLIEERGNSVPYTGKLDDLSEHPVKEIIHKVLKIDAKEAMDIAAHAQFNLTPLTVAPTGGTSTTAVTLETTGCTVTNNVAFGKGHVQPIATTMKERGIPPFQNDDYLGIGWPSTFDNLKNDLETINQYVETGVARLMNGEIGRYRGVRFLEQTHIPKGGAVDSTTWDPHTDTADAWNNGKSDWIFFLGADTVAEGIACLEEIRGKIPEDYGRSRGIAWYALNGFGLSHTGAANARVIKWESAA